MPGINEIPEDLSFDQLPEILKPIIKENFERLKTDGYYNQTKKKLVRAPDFGKIYVTKGLESVVVPIGYAYSLKKSFKRRWDYSQKPKVLKIQLVCLVNDCIGDKLRITLFSLLEFLQNYEPCEC